uniref:Ig-like domain-containing protein n=1 Tax=Bactrocera latifrons TaxID=174628 RepID=A0A0K8V0A9_BACLA
MQFKATTRFAYANCSKINNNKSGKNNNNNSSNYSESNNNNKTVTERRDFVLIYAQLHANQQQQSEQQQNKKLVQLGVAHKMQTTTNTNTELNCICALPRGNNKNNNNKSSCNNNHSKNFNSQSDAYTSTAATRVCNMAAATIPTAMTDDSGCCKCARSNNMQHCGKDVDYITAAAPAPAAAMAVACAERSTPTQCCKYNMQDSLSKYNKNNQHNSAVNWKNNFVASESAKKDCKHSAVIRSIGCGSGENLLATAAEIKTKTTTKATSMHTAFDIGNWKSICAMILLLFSFTWHDYALAALSNVSLYIEPPAVRRGQSVILRCQYSLEGAPLYSIKYYRGNYEFYRYTPGEFPNVKHFQYPGIKVDEVISNATQVVIRDVKFTLSGNFSCEVTADAPLFSTATAYAQVQVVEFPEKRPQLFTEHARYEPGDILRANCSTPPSRPRADLQFTLNNIPVSTGETQYIRTVDNLIASRLSLKLQLHAAHFVAGINTQHLMNHLGGSQAAMGVSYNTGVGVGGGVAGNGGLVLRCTAQIGNLYQEYKEIELGTPQKDPVPARVTLSSGSSLRNFFEYFSAASSAASTTTTSTTQSIARPLKLMVLAAAVWRSQALLLGLAAGLVGAYSTLRLKPATNASR